jgi:Domain of unknown function (DUF222)
VRFVIVDPTPVAPPAEGEELRVLPDDLAPLLSETEIVADIWSADARAAREHALLLRAVCVLARRRRLSTSAETSDATAGSRVHPELADLGEDFVSELALTRACSEFEADRLAVEAIRLCGKLSATWAELYAGRISIRKAQAIADLLGDLAAATAHKIEAAVLPRAATRDTSWLRATIRRRIATHDAAALDRRRAAAAARRDVFRQPTGDGLSELIVQMTTGEATACWQAIDTYARMWKRDGDARPLGVLRSEIARDLILRPWDTGRAPVTAVLTIHATLDALRDPDLPGPPSRPDDDQAPQAPAEVDGEVVTAAECRELLRRLDMLGLRPAPAGGCVRVAVGDPAGRLIAVATRAELTRAAGHRRARRRTRRSHPDRAEAAPAAAPPDGPGLRPPPGTTRYRPTAAQQRHVQTRDRTCRMPSCRRPPGRCDVDHATAHGSGGPTECWNLCCLCRRHHRIKTFAPGWAFTLLRDGTLVVRTPAGVTRTTAPPGIELHEAPDPPWLDETGPPDPVFA